MSLDENNIKEPVVEGGESETATPENFEAENPDIVDNSVQDTSTENQENIETPVSEDFSKEDEENSEFKCGDKKKQSKCAKKEEDSSEDKSGEDEKDDKEDEEDKKKFSALSAEHEQLKQQYSELQANYQALEKFKNEIERAKKEEMINSFYMLSDEDKQEVIENKDKFTLAEIESKLSVIFAKKSLAEMNSKTETENSSNPSVTFSLNDNELNSAPAWISAVRNTKNSRN